MSEPEWQEEATSEAEQFFRDLKGVEAIEEEPVEQEEQVSPVIRYVRNLDGDYHTTGEVADELGVSDQLIRKWARQRVADVPSYVAPFGNTHIYLYTSDDIEQLREYHDRRYKVIPYDEFEGNAQPDNLKDKDE